MRSDLELNGYLQDNSADSGIDATSFTATQSSTASSTAAFRAKQRAQWQDDGPDTQRTSDTPPLTPDLLAVGAESKEATTPSAFPLEASRSRCGTRPLTLCSIKSLQSKETLCFAIKEAEE